MMIAAAIPKICKQITHSVCNRTYVLLITVNMGAEMRCVTIEFQGVERKTLNR